MERQIIQTSDGSTTIHLPQWDESYHSRHGAIQEARHVFIRNGFTLVPSDRISILEIGFGTGLNALITFLASVATGKSVDYTGVEAYPVSAHEVLQMNYVEALGTHACAGIFEQMHQSAWEVPMGIGSGATEFTLTKRKQFFHQIDDVDRFDLIYFDAFGFRVQPELWSHEIFGIMYRALRPGGILVTYAARSVIKRNMSAAGFTVDKCPGPPGKREMFRATKP